MLSQEEATKKLENKILFRSNKKYCVVTGNATTAIYLTIKSLNLNKPKVLIPNSVCHNVHLAVILAGAIPCFIDINKKNFGIDTLKLDKVGKPNIVLATHSYGNPCDIFKVQKFCRKNNILLIEDCALVSGARKNKKYFGDYGNFSIFSFGKDKIMDLGFGGAVVTNNFHIYQKIKLMLRKLKFVSSKKIEAINKMNSYYKEIYNNYFLNNNYSKIYPIYNRKIISRSRNYLYKLSNSQILQVNKRYYMIDRLIEKKINQHTKILKIFKKYNFNSVKVFKINKHSVPWKFNLLVKKNRNYLFKKLLESKLPVSSWYAPNNLFVSKNLNFKYLKNSIEISNNILNLPLDQNYSFYKKIFLIIKDFEKKKIL